MNASPSPVSPAHARAVSIINQFNHHIVPLRVVGNPNANGFHMCFLKACDYMRVRIGNKTEWVQVVKVNKKSFNVRINGFSVPMKYSAGWFNNKENVSAGAGEYVRWSDYEIIKRFKEQHGVDYFDI